jgi:hypothetical protein
MGLARCYESTSEKLAVEKTYPKGVLALFLSMWLAGTASPKISQAQALVRFPRGPNALRLLPKWK